MNRALLKRCVSVMFREFVIQNQNTNCLVKYLQSLDEVWVGFVMVLIMERLFNLCRKGVGVIAHIGPAD